MALRHLAAIRAGQIAEGWKVFGPSPLGGQSLGQRLLEADAARDEHRIKHIPLWRGRPERRRMAPPAAPVPDCPQVAARPRYRSHKAIR